MDRHRTTGCLLLVAAWAWCGPARAAPVAHCAKEAKARVRFAQGVKAVRVDDYPSALAAFEDAYRICPLPTILFNIGMAQKALYHLVDASRTLRQYLAQSSGAGAVKLRAQARAAVDEIDKSVGKLQVSSAPAKTELRVDGRRRATAPWPAPIPIDPGQHVIELTHPGYVPYQANISIRAGQEIAIDAGSMRPRDASIHVECTPGAAVFSGEKRLGPCPYGGQLAPGPYALLVRAPDGRVKARSVELKPGDNTVVTIRLDAHAAEPGSTPAGRKQSSPAQPDSSRASSVHVFGWMALGVGAGALAWGVYSTYEWKVHDDEVNSAKAAAEAAQTPAEFQQRLAEYDQIRDRVVNHDHPLDVAGMAVGYGAAAALTVTGILLLNQRARSSAQLELGPTGVWLQGEF